VRALVCLLLALAGVPLFANPVFEDTMAQRVLACSACHGKEGRAGPDGFYPRIAGKPAGYLYNQLLNFRDGRRHYGLMAQLLDPLSDAYLLEIARHFASLDLPYPPPAAPSAPAPVLERGEQLALHGDATVQVPGCVQCHGAKLTGILPNTPGLLGLPHDYLLAQLGAWRTGQRRAHAPDCMAQVAQRLTPEDLAAVTSWLASHPLPVDAHPGASLPAPPPIACGSASLPAGSPRP
jgi:cytochrome c553